LPNVIYAGGVEEKLPLLEGRVMDEALIFVCQEGACGLPVKKASEAIDLLK
jgi:hypothetical protein